MIAAVLHASWNRLLHAVDDRVAAMSMAGIVTGVLMLPAILIWPPWAAWPFILASATAHTFYALGLSAAYKRGALSDAPVSAWLEAHAVPVLIDVTKGMTPDAERLGVSPIPATFVLRDGEIVAQHAGLLTSQKLMRMLESASAQ